MHSTYPEAILEIIVLLKECSIVDDNLSIGDP
jgi:hypothetical protein